MIAAICIGDAAAAGRHAVEPAFVERLEKDEDGARTGHLLRLDQLLATAELASSDEVLHLRDDHGDDRPGLRYARDLGRHSDLHDLCLYLPKAGLPALPPGTLRDQDPARTHHRVDEVAHSQGELFHAPAHAGPDDGLGQLHFRLGERGFGAGLLGWQESGGPRLGGVLCCGGGSNTPFAALHGDFEPLDVAAGDNARVTTEQLLLRLQLIQRLLVGALRLLDLAFGSEDIGPRYRLRRLDLATMRSPS
jgi:hypothetical protein